MARKHRLFPSQNLVRDARSGFTHYSHEMEEDYYGQVVKRGTGDGLHPLDAWDEVASLHFDEASPHILNNYSPFEFIFPPEDWGFVTQIPNQFFDLVPLYDLCIDYAYDLDLELTEDYDYTANYDYGSIEAPVSAAIFTQGINNTVSYNLEYGDV